MLIYLSFYQVDNLQPCQHVVCNKLNHIITILVDTVLLFSQWDK